MDEQNYSTIKMMVGDTMAFGIIKLILFHTFSWKKNLLVGVKKVGAQNLFSQS